MKLNSRFQRMAKFASLMLVLCAALLVGAGSALAAECQSARIEYIMSNAAQCNGYAMFATDRSNNIWICAASAQQLDLLLAAHLSGKLIDYELVGGTTDPCYGPSNYNWNTRVEYLILR